MPAAPFRRAALVGMLLMATACGGSDDGSSSEAAADEPATELRGLFALAPGECTADGVTGSYFRMVQSGGDVEEGPFMDNGDSACDDKTWSPLEPGTDGGLITGDYQPQEAPLFQPDGTSTASRIVTPARFFAIGFGLSTNEVDPQTQEDVAVPSISSDGERLTGDLSALSVSWNQQHFNQGAPKPGVEDGEGITGTYDAETGAYAIDWTSTIEGGPFDGFSGIWHFEGTFTAA